MSTLTLTPDLQAYVTSIIVVYTLGGVALADMLASRVARLGRAPFLPSYTALMTAVLGLASVSIDLPLLTQIAWPQLVVGLPAGVLAGLIAIRLEQALLRRLQRGASILAASPRALAQAHQAGHRPPRATPLVGGPALRQPARTADSAAPRRYARASLLTPALLVYAGALEELLFRGVLVQLTLRLESAPFVLLLLLMNVALFALSHARWGAVEAAAKIPLGAITLGITLIMQSTWPAVIAHAAFNLLVWRSLAEGSPRRALQW